MITRIQGCFLDRLELISDGSVDLLLTDPPYNISEVGAKPEWLDPVTGENKNTIHSQKFDESFEEQWDSLTHEDFLAELDRWSTAWQTKLRKGGTFAIFISDRYLSYLWTALESAGLEPKRVIVWKKPAAVPFNRKSNPVSGCEYIVWGIKPGTRTFNADQERYSRVERHSLADKAASMVYKAILEAPPGEDLHKTLRFVGDDIKAVRDKRKQTGGLIECVIPNTITFSGGLGRDKIHPTQKPEEVLKYLIELCSNPGDLVLDTFAGSGSTGMAAQHLGRDAILVERDAKMFAKMDARFTTLDNFEIE